MAEESYAFIEKPVRALRAAYDEGASNSRTIWSRAPSRSRPSWAVRSSRSCQKHGWQASLSCAQVFARLCGLSVTASSPVPAPGATP